MDMMYHILGNGELIDRLQMFNQLVWFPFLFCRKRHHCTGWKDVKVENDMENSLLSMRLCRDYPGRLAIVGNGQSCTYEEMHRGILGLEKRLRAMGVKQGSRVALWSYNSANWLIAFFAIVRSGGTAALCLSADGYSRIQCGDRTPGPC